MKSYLVLIIASIGSVIPINSQTPSAPQSSTLYRATKTFNHKVREVYTTKAHPAIDFIDEIEPNDSPAQAQQLSGPFPVGVIGSVSTSDIGSKSVMGDDVEDLYKINITSNYVKLNLYDFSADLDLFLFKIEGVTTTIMGSNHNGTTEEEYERSDLDPGTYYVGVSIYDAFPIQNSSSYKLTVMGDTDTSEVDEVHIEDPNFLDALIEEGVDINGDGIISIVEAESVNSLNLYNKEISNMTGIEAFVNLDYLNCFTNKLTSLDLSGNTQLEQLVCASNELNSLNISNNTALIWLRCYGNRLTTLDVSNNTSLKKLECDRNQLTSLDISNNVHLQWLGCTSNELTSLDVSNNNSLMNLFCGANHLSNLDISNNKLLQWLSCWENDLTSLDISNNTLLEALGCDGNQLTIVDVREHSKLREFYCSDNLLTKLDVTNNILLEALECGSNLLTKLDLTNNAALENDVTFHSDLDISNMPSLEKVCVWTMPFPPENFDLNIEGSTNVVFTTECGDQEAPELNITVDNLYQPDFIEAISSEDGFIYLVPQNTNKVLEDICAACIDSVAVIANEISSIPLSGIDNGFYWLYARDSSKNISNSKEFTILGVSIEHQEVDYIHIYPNPVANQLTLETGTHEIYVAEINSLNGNILFASQFSDPILQLDFSCYQKGVYIITIRSEDFVTTRKIIKL